jgi:long-subunit fatty acid transport protein
MKILKITHWLFLACCFAGLFQANAQNGTPPIGGARSAAMGGVGAAFEDVNSVFSNQAGMAEVENLSFSLLAEQRFLLNAIRTVAAGGVLPLKSGSLGLTLNYYGTEAYNEQRVSLAYARKLMENFSIGAGLDFLNTNIPEYGSKGVMTFELGLMARFTPQLNMGVHVFNPLNVELIEGEKLPSILKLGLKYSPSEKVDIFGEVSKDVDFAIRTHWGVEYEVVEDLNLRAGVATQPVEVTFGAGYKLNNGLMIDVGSRYHEVLGISPSVGIVYVGKKKE